MKQLNEKLIKILILFVIGVAIFLFITFLMTRDKVLSFNTIEKNLKTAAINYYKQNQTLLPTNNGDKVVVSGSELESKGYIKPMSKMVKEGLTCSSEVRVLKSFDTYIYIPYLNCGESYVTKELHRVINSGDNISVTGSGLYKMGNEYVFRGSDVKNYIKISDQLWRIVKIDSNNNTQIILDTIIDYSVWDNRYNLDTKRASGINKFEDKLTEDSRIKMKLETLIDNNRYLKNNDKHLLAMQSLCAGARQVGETNSSGAVECALKSENVYFGLLSVYELLQASLDPNCKSENNVSCSNYNYLADLSGSWWTATPVAGTSNKAFYINRTARTEEAYYSYSLRPTLLLNSYVVYESGSGTKTDPYIVKSFDIKK